MSDEPRLIITKKPTLRNPSIVCGLSGWINSGNVATGGINYFIKQLKAEKFAELPASRYHIYQISDSHSLTPFFKMQEGLIVETQFPRNEFYYAENPVSDHDLILFLGTEPNLNWEEYADTVVSLASDLGASRLFSFGGLLAKIPYTREPVMTCTCSGTRVKNDMDQYNVMYSNREGPATFNQMLVHACKKKGLDGATFTVRVPYYPEFNIAVGYSSKSIRAILVRLNHILHLDINFDELDNEINELHSKLDSIRQQNPKFNTYIEELEKEYVEMTYEETLEISPSEAIKFAEEFLKENKDQPGN
ncbi:MAG: PAC2 family protein [Dehalococcoidales bacterium]|nr:PAC2 family protein [Dehalococcoidales bacterium]